MAGKAVRTGAAEINPMFFIPDGVEELKYGEDVFVEEDSGTDDAGTFSGDEGSSVPDKTDYSNPPEGAQILGIISQAIRMTPAGNEVVDVIFNVSPVSGATKYELRIVKV